MANRLTIGASLLAGIALGAATAGSLYAQGKPVYVIAVFNEMDPAFVAASKGAPAAIAAAGGKVLARSDAPVALDGAAVPKRLTLLSFESADKAKAWLKSDGMKETEAARAKFTKSGVFMLDAM